jgi:2',3'-cyclic-nucleotide 2'-phosphodiesterase (5'-nucleotidase family)
VAQEREAAEHLLLVDTGDALVGGGPLGDATQGAVIVDGMNLMGYEAMAIGPQELSLGLDVLRQRMAEAKFPMLSANVVQVGTEELVAQPYMVLDLAGHRVGIIGLTRVPDGKQAGFQVLDSQAAAARYVPEVAEQADTIVLLTNVGYRQALEIAGAVPGIDLVVAGLPDLPMGAAARAPGTGALAVSAEQPLPRHSGRQVGRLTVTLGSDGSLSGESWESVPMDKGLADEPLMTALVDKYRQ